MKKTIQNITIELVQGDIASQSDMDAVVNAANSNLQPGGGVAGALHEKAGPELEEACKPLSPIKPGEAVITEGFNLPNDYVIHVLGPVYGINKPEDLLLRKSYDKVLSIAEEHAISRIAFPALSTGAFHYPLEDAADVALKAVIDKLCSLSSVKHIRFVLYDQKSLKIHEEALQRIAD
ncbi:MAG: macro domain-containing protein [Bacillota bacterium]